MAETITQNLSSSSEDGRVDKLINDPEAVKKLFTSEEILQGYTNYYAWKNRLTAVLNKIDKRYSVVSEINDETAGSIQIDEHLDRLLDVIIRNSIAGTPRAMIRHIHGIEAYNVLRLAHGGNPAKRCIPLLKEGLAPSGPDESVTQRAMRFEKTYRQVLAAGLSRSEIFAIMAVVACNNDKLIQVIQNYKNFDLEAENLVGITEDISAIYPECLEDETRENAFESHANRLRAKQSSRYRPRDASHRCTRCGFIGHRSSNCKLDWDSVQRYRNNRKKKQERDMLEAFSKVTK